MRKPPNVAPSERFFEANFCSEVAYQWHPCRLTWFTPSTVDEADLAFDTYANFGGRFFFFQFKFPTTWRERRTICPPKHSYLQTHADHDQMMELRGLAASWPPQTVMYAMPGFLDYAPAHVLPVTHYWDVLSIPPNFPPPTTYQGGARLSRKHQLNLCPVCDVWTVRSEPHTMQSSRVSGLFEDFANELRAGDIPDVPGSLRRPVVSREAYDALMVALGPQAAGLLVTPPR